MKKLVLFLTTCLIATSFCYTQEREVLISESFTPYNIGSKIAVAANSLGNYWWTTWSNSPGSTEDGIVANYGGNKCGHLTYGNDQVLLLGDEDTGTYDLEFDILVPQGKNGYFNILHHFAGTNSTWAMQCYLHLINDGQNSTQAPGHGTIHAGSNSTADIACVYNAWMHFRLNVDTDQDIARFYYTAPGANEILVCSWQWSLDSFGENVVGRTLSAMDFFPVLNASTSEFYLDNFVLNRVGGNYYTITVSASPANGGTVTGGGTCAQGSTCTLHAVANGGYSFVKWTKNGTQVSTNPDYSFTVTGNASYVAHFQQSTQNYTITVSADPANGGTVTGGGTYAQGSTCTLHAVANGGYSFVKWTKNGTQVSTNPDYSFTVTGNASYVSHFQQSTQNYTITVSADPANGGAVTGGGTYAQGSTCTLTASPNSGYVFEGWTKEGIQISTNPVYSFAVTGSASYVAHFQQGANQNTVTAMAIPADGGLVFGGGTYEQGATCTLTATANNGFFFVNWTDANGNQVSVNSNFTFTVTSNVIYIANFTQSVDYYNIVARAEPYAGGSVSGAGVYMGGSVCTLMATSSTGFSFVCWKDDGVVVSTESLYSFIVSGDRSLVAEFSQEQLYTITASSGANGIISPEGVVTVANGEDKTFAMIPDNGSSVGRVVVDGIDVGPVESYTFRNVNENHTIHVQFSGLGLYEGDYSSNLRVYPNPAKGNVNIEGAAIKRVTVFNLLGVREGVVEVNDDNVMLNIEGLVQGTYLLKIEYVDGSIGYSHLMIVK